MKHLFLYLKFIVVCAASFFAINIHAAPQADTIFDPSVVFDPSIETPDTFLGHRLGDQMVRNDRMIDYFKYLASK